MTVTRFLYRPGHPRASANGFVAYQDLEDHERPAPLRMAKSHVCSDLYMDGLRTADTGIDIGSRAKRRSYMKENGLADFDDFKGTWEKAEKDRAAPDPTLREDIERAFYDVREKNYKPERGSLDLEVNGKVERVVPPECEHLFEE
jgi:hypothetical protein